MPTAGKGTAKEKTLKMLEACRGSALSGEKLAEQIGVSRAAVWKAIESLRSEGYSIAASTKKGYILDDDSDLLSAQGILLYLDPEKFPETEQNIITYKTLSSTNHAAKQAAFEGAADGTVILSEEQTQGRGRLGRSFYSPSGTGLYLSYILKPRFDISKSLLITTAASVAVCRAIAGVCQVEAQIKWVNDILIQGKKVCGILTEAITNFESGQIDTIVIGIGINCSTKQEDYPEEIRVTAGSLPVKVSRNRLAAAVISELREILAHFDEGPYPEFMDEYRRRSVVLRKDILVFQNYGKEEGLRAKAIDISDDGGLIVIYENGMKETLTTGEISIRMV